jgi:hypothetical protein
MPLSLPKTTVPSHQYVNGRWRHYVSQSDIKDFEHCPDAHRRKLLELDPPMQNDSALLGTVFATYPQNRINGLGRHEAAEIVRDLLTNGSTEHRYPIYGWHSEYLNQVTFKSIEEAWYILVSAMELCEEELPKLPKGTRAEVGFEVKVHSDLKRDVYIKGASDMWLPDGSIQDWKLSGQDYVGRDAWKFQRYDPQPGHYILGRALVENSAVFSKSFTYVNIHRSKMVVQRLPLQLTKGDLTWHLQRVLRLCDAVEAHGFDNPWPINPTDWWCSNVWCASWKECRGKHIGDDPWQLLERKRKGLGLSVNSGT